MLTECRRMYNSPVPTVEDNRKALLSPKQILDTLVDAGAIKRSASLSVQSFAGDAGRRHGARRQLHRIWRDGQPQIQLYIAPDLSALERSAAGFYQACPSVVCKPLFFVKQEGLDYLGMEFVDGSNAEEAYAGQTLSPEALLQSLATLDAALAETEEASTLEAASAELDDLLKTLSETELFNDSDLSLLHSFVAPKLKAILLAHPPKTRWTNGDFITRNIIVSKRGPKLVDYEFAARTHYYGEDWARLSRYSPALPAGVLALVQARLGDRHAALNIYGLLRQFVLEARVKRVVELNREVANIARQLIPLLDQWRVESAPSVFLPTPLDPTVPGNAKAQVQAFYSDTAEFSASNTIFDEALEGVWKRIELPLPIGSGAWHIRFDPLHCTGIVQLASMEFATSARERGQPVNMSELTASGTCAIAAMAPVLTLICYGSDPQLHLPVLPVDGPGPVRLAVWMRWERLETGLERTVREMTRERPMGNSPDKVALRRAEIKVQELLATLQQEKLRHASAAQTAVELQGEIAQLTARLAEQAAGAQKRDAEWQERSVEAARQMFEVQSALGEATRIRTELEIALGHERALRTELTAASEQQSEAHTRFQQLVEERQRTYDQGALEGVARTRDLHAALNKEKTMRDFAERARDAAEQQVSRYAAEEVHRRNELTAQHRAERERLETEYTNLLRHERTARAQAELVLQERSIEHKNAEVAFQRTLADLALSQRRLEAQLRDGSTHQENLEKHLASQQLRIATLERSLSWKVTAPVRQVANLLNWPSSGRK